MAMVRYKLNLWVYELYILKTVHMTTCPNQKKIYEKLLSLLDTNHL